MRLHTVVKQPRARHARAMAAATAQDLDLSCLEGLDADSSWTAWANCLAGITKQGIALGLSAAQAQQIARDQIEGRAADAGGEDEASVALAWSDGEFLGIPKILWLLAAVGLGGRILRLW